MPQLDPETARKLFFAVWGGLFVASLVFWQLASPPLKRKVRPYAMVSIGAVFLLFVYLSGPVKQFYFALVPVAVIMFLNLKTVRICPRCGQSNRPIGFFSPPSYCNKCGTALEG